MAGFPHKGGLLPVLGYLCLWVISVYLHGLGLKGAGHKQGTQAKVSFVKLPLDFARRVHSEWRGGTQYRRSAA